MTNYPSSLIAVVGPTGSGKSEIGIYLARELNGEIVGCDSVQVYSGVDVGSAKVPVEHREEVPHHLVDIAAPTGKVTAGEYARLARAAIFDIARRGRLPIVVGGTGLYLKALLEGLSPAPPRDEQFRERLYRAVARRPEVLVRYLRRFDRESAGRIHPNDRQKMTRAVEICHVSRQSASVVHRTSRDALTGLRILKLGLNPERASLYEKLNTRAEWMFANGLLAETESLVARYRSSDLEVLCSLGYLQAVKCLNGEWSAAEAIADCQIKTRNYAKRQMTWFRSDPTISWINAFGSSDKAKSIALHTASKFLGKQEKTS